MYLEEDSRAWNWQTHCSQYLLNPVCFPCRISSVWLAERVTSEYWTIRYSLCWTSTWRLQRDRSNMFAASSLPFTSSLSLPSNLAITTVLVEVIGTLGLEYEIKGTMLAIFSNTLKSRKLHFPQWKPTNSGPVLLKVTILVHWNYQWAFLAADGEDGSGFEWLKKLGQPCKVHQGYFRVAVTLILKERLSANPFMWKYVYIQMQIKPSLVWKVLL